MEVEECHDSPPKKKKKVKEKKQCFIYKKDTTTRDSNKTFIFNPSVSSITNLLQKITTRYENSELQFGQLYSEIENLTAQNLFEEKISYHKKCITDITNRELVERGENRLEKANGSADFTVVVNKKYR